MNRIAVCSWSLRPTCPEDLFDKVRACGLAAVQLHLDPVRRLEWRADQVGSLARSLGITIVSGMFAPKGEDYSTLDTIKATGGVRPEATWPDNLRAAEGNAIAAARLGISLVTFHAGFLPHDAADVERAAMISRLRQVAEVMAARNVRVAFETGQESAETLLDVLGEINESLPDRARVGVNFDPANMILYGMGDPVESLRRLLPHVVQVHVKDASPTATPGTWGEEKAVGDGAVDWPSFFRVLRDSGYRGDFVIEREAGEDRAGDVRRARELIARHWPA